MIVTSGLVSYYNSKQGVSGSTWSNIAPATTGSYDGTLYGTVVGAEGMTFTGSEGDYVEIPLPTDLQTVSNATFEFRMKVSSRGGNEVISDGTSDYMLYAWTGGFRSSGIFNVSRTDFTEDISDVGEGDMIISITADATNGLITYYVNGVKVAEESATVDKLVPSNLIRIGSHSTTYSPTGVIDNIRIYNRILTEAEIQQNVDVWDEVGLTTVTPPSTVDSYSLTEDFEDATYNFTFAGGWSTTATVFHTGTKSMVSPATANDASTSLTFDVTIPSNAVDPSISIWVKPSSEADYDFAKIYVNDAIFYLNSGNPGWGEVVLPLRKGQTNSIEIKYIKDSGAAANDDCVYIDDITVSYDVEGSSVVAGSLFIKTGSVTLEVFYYNEGDVDNPILRVYDGSTFCFDLVDPTESTPLRIMTPLGIKGIVTG